MTRRPANETAEPRRRYQVPRHLWPAAWDQLTEARAAFVTGLPLPEPETGCASPVELYVSERGAVILERLGVRLIGSGPDPWIARMRELDRRRREAAAEQAKRDAVQADALEAAFQREARRIREAQNAPESEARS